MTALQFSRSLTETLAKAKVLQGPAFAGPRMVLRQAAYTAESNGQDIRSRVLANSSALAPEELAAVILALDQLP